MNGPAVGTYINAIKNNWLATFPGLTAEAVLKHLPKAVQTAMGHLHRVRKNLRSTTKVTLDMIMNEITDEPALDPPRKIHNREHYVCINAIGFPELNGMISTDQMGRFLITSG